tara:strand:- start:86 stop:238 length:153 start_codon:yes stop_codon:yes gene_type:complete
MLNLQDYQILTQAVRTMTIKGSDATTIAVLLGKLEKATEKEQKKLASKAS